MSVITEAQIEALGVAMTLAPGVWVRNRMFDFFGQTEVKRAKSRAAVLRGIIPHLARATAIALSAESRAGEVVHVLRYRVANVRLSRVVELSTVELAALRVLSLRARLTCLPPSDGDRALVESTLACLLDLGVGQGRIVATEL